MTDSHMPSVSVIATVKDEAASIGKLLESLFAQTWPPDEVVIVDGGSRDGTPDIVRAFGERGLPIKLIVKPGCNISQGRNEAIRAASHDLVASTDAGVRLSPVWLAELISPFTGGDPRAGPDVVSGFFAADPDPRSPFEKAMGATVLPALRDVKPERFLPSSRSVAFTRQAWRLAGGYPEWLDYCEDLIFDLALLRAGCRFVFAAKAVAYFRPRSSLRTFFKQYYRYARGDGKADLWRTRHAVRYGTYAVGPLAFLLGFWYKLLWLPLALGSGAYLYGPYRRLVPSLASDGAREKVEALLLVPLIRLIGDVAKMLGYPVGVWWRLRHRSSGRWRA